MENGKMKLIFKDFSHITVKLMCRNDIIKKVEKGSRYTPSAWDAKYRIEKSNKN